MYSYSVFNEHPPRSLAVSLPFVGLYSYQLPSLIPVKPADSSRAMGSSGLEPPTSRLSGARSNQLSYEPVSPESTGDGGNSTHVTFKQSPGLFECRFAAPLLFESHVKRPESVSGDGGIRTRDPLLAGQVLSQLSYTPASLSPRPATLTQN